MKKLVLILSFCIFLISKEVSAQKILYQLHPMVGDTIEMNEIEKYYLFNKNNLDSISYLIFQDNNVFYLVGISEEKNLKQIELTNEEILLEKEKVEKLMKYYSSKQNKDTITNVRFKEDIQINDSLNVKLNIVTPEFVKSMKKENRRKFWDDKRQENKLSKQKGMIYDH